MTKELKNKIEAVLFIVGNFISIQEIAKICGFGSIGLIKQVLEELKKDYENKNTSLIIEQKQNKYKLNIKKQYLPLTKNLILETEFDTPTQETLAIIAHKQPILQSQVVKIRGNKAYSHIRILKQNNLITAEKSGRTKLLKLTKEFYNYFDITKTELKQKLSEKCLNS